MKHFERNYYYYYYYYYYTTSYPMGTGRSFLEGKAAEA
jgi:hypothetical protein